MDTAYDLDYAPDGKSILIAAFGKDVDLISLVLPKLDGSGVGFEIPGLQESLDEIGLGSCEECGMQLAEFSPAGDTVAAMSDVTFGSSDIMLWQVDGKFVRKISGSRSYDFFTSLIYSPDGQMLIAAGRRVPEYGHEGIPIVARWELPTGRT